MDATLRYAARGIDSAMDYPSSYLLRGSEVGEEPHSSFWVLDKSREVEKESTQSTPNKDPY